MNLCVIRRVESVQRRFTKELPGLKQLSYRLRRSTLSLDTHELRRLHSDLIVCYEIVLSIVRYVFLISSLFYFSYRNSRPSLLFICSFFPIFTPEKNFKHRVAKFRYYVPAVTVDFTMLNRFKGFKPFQTAQSCFICFNHMSVITAFHFTILHLYLKYCSVSQFLPRELCSSRYMPWSCVCLCLSVCVCPSQVGVLLKWLNIGTR